MSIFFSSLSLSSCRFYKGQLRDYKTALTIPLFQPLSNFITQETYLLCFLLDAFSILQIVQFLWLYFALPWMQIENVSNTGIYLYWKKREKLAKSKIIHFRLNSDSLDTLESKNLLLSNTKIRNFNCIKKD